MTEKQAGVLIPFPPQCISEPLDKSLGSYKFRARFLASDLVSLLIMPALFLITILREPVGGRLARWDLALPSRN